jgi:hypothetical protein
LQQVLYQAPIVSNVGQVEGKNNNAFIPLDALVVGNACTLQADGFGSKLPQSCTFML